MKFFKDRYCQDSFCKELYCKEEVPLKKIRGRVDVLLEYQKLAIEYDGVWSHSLKGAKEKDKKK